MAKKKTTQAPAPMVGADELIDLNAVRWLANGNRGISSNTLFMAITGVDTAGRSGHYDTPSDAWDFARCARLLVVCPQFRPHMDRVAALNKTWATLVAHWELLETALRAEWPALFVVGEYERPEKHPEVTYAILKLLLKRVERANAAGDKTYALAA